MHSDAAPGRGALEGERPTRHAALAAAHPPFFARTGFAGAAFGVRFLIWARSLPANLTISACSLYVLSMVRRSTPQKTIDDNAFPVRVKIVVPPCGLGRLLTEADDWLRRNLAPRDHACHGAKTFTGDAVAYYFRTARDAAAFLDAVPLTLADGTTARGYSAPQLGATFG